MLKRISLLVAVSTLVGTSLAFASGGNRNYSWQLTPTGSTASLRGLSAVSENVAWASGSIGTVLRTTDRGATWQSVGPPGTDGASVPRHRGVRQEQRPSSSRSATHPTPSASTARRTPARPGRSAFQNTEPTAFYDCMAFFDKHRGLALSDPINGRFRILATTRRRAGAGGSSMRRCRRHCQPSSPSPPAASASPTAGGRDAWFGTGGDAVARVFHSSDRGQTWTVSSTPMLSGPTAGINALAFRDTRHGLAAGGDFAAPTVAPDSLALSADGGGQLEPRRRRA